MSVFIPRRPDSAGNSPTAPALPAVRSAQRWGWSLSVALHTAAYVGLIMAGLFGATSPSARSTELRASEMRSDPATADARTQVQQILRTQQELERIRARVQTEYERWLQEQRRSAVPDLQRAIQAAGKAQAQAVPAQTRAEAAQQAAEQARFELAQAQNSAQQSSSLSRMEHAASELAGAQAAAQQAQDRAAQAYATAANSLEFADGVPASSAEAIRQGLAGAVQAQTQAREAQNHAGETAAALTEQIRGLRASTAASADLQRRAQSASQKSQKAQEQVERATTVAQQLAAQAHAAHDGANYLTAHAALTHLPADQKAALEAQQRNAELTPQAQQAYARWQKLKDQAQAAQGEVQRLRQAAAQQDADWKQRVGALAEMSRQNTVAQQAALQAQQQAFLQHSQLEAAARQLPEAPPEVTREVPSDRTDHKRSNVSEANTESGAKGEAKGGTQEGGPAGAAEGAPGLRGGRTDASALNGQDLAQLYDAAVTAERANLETFRQIQAHTAAMAQHTSLERALAETDSTPPVRPLLGNYGRPTLALVAEPPLMTPEQREEARQQIASMAALSQQMLHRSQPRPSPSRGTDVAVSALDSSAVPSARRIALATEEEGRAAKDLTDAAPGTGSGNTDTPGPDQKSHKWSTRPRGDVHLPSAPPASPPVAIRALPGRTVGPGDRGGEWMFVDSWHTIGPFPNPDRRNINKPFPPEAGVDLDAVYVGKDNRLVRWSWLQSATPMVVPNDPEEYAVYYGYTELWFDEPADLWIAIGSDDKSTLWVEDQLVWVSSDVLKGWRIDEGFRKVHFKKGLNRILFRLENGWRGVGVSVCISLQPR